MGKGVIELRGVSVNNLRHVDLDLPRGKLIAICGVSGSGKTSLALDTLYAEGQRRYIETFSPHARQFLEQLDKPSADRIDGIPPAVAVTRKHPSRSHRVTVGTTTEINSLLAAVLTRVGEIVCYRCGRPVRRDSPQAAADAVAQLPAGRRAMVAFEAKAAENETPSDRLAALVDAGYVRAILNGRSVDLSPALASQMPSDRPLPVVIDRLTTDGTTSARLHDSLEAAFAAATGNVIVYIEDAESPSLARVDERTWQVLRFNAELRCNDCDLPYLPPETQLFNFNRPLGACPACEGLGEIVDKKANTAAPCSVCNGARLRPEVLSIRVAEKNLDDFTRMTVSQLANSLTQLPLVDWQETAVGGLIEDIRRLLQYLRNVGLGYLTLNRTIRSLSAGEAQRVALTSALGATLVDMLYVLDEPSVGLHPCDVALLTAAIKDLQSRGNTVVAVEHEETILRQADEIVEIGPGAGVDGGQVIFQGTPANMIGNATTRTGRWLAGERAFGSSKRRAADHGRMRLAGARGHNLRNLTVEFPLGVLCVVTGVSGAGKSTLIEETLYPALRKRFEHEVDPATLPPPLPYDELLGTGQLEAVEFVDQSPIGRSPRSNPATYLKAFDPIRTLFAEQTDAKARGFAAGHFSFNVDGGRCEACRGDGFRAIDMHFMADVLVRCPECGGRRYRREVLEIKYRGRNIAEVLEMTGREAFTWFRGEHAVQARIKPLLDVGLDYLRLGQPANTLSGGEAQRLKLGGQLSAKKSGRTLFLLDEPTTGLHYADIVKLLDCFDALLDVGHSLIVIEHNLQLMAAADHLIDLGPGAALDGGRVVAFGTPEEVAACEASFTGQFLAREFAKNVDN